MTSETPWTKGPYEIDAGFLITRAYAGGVGIPIIQLFDPSGEAGLIVGDEAERGGTARLLACSAEFADLAADLLAHVDRSDLDDLDFGRGLAQSGLIERTRALLARAKGEEQPTHRTTKGA